MSGEPFQGSKGVLLWEETSIFQKFLRGTQIPPFFTHQSCTGLLKNVICLLSLLPARHRILDFQSFRSNVSSFGSQRFDLDPSDRGSEDFGRFRSARGENNWGELWEKYGKVPWKVCAKFGVSLKFWVYNSGGFVSQKSSWNFAQRAWMTPKCEDFPNLHGSNQTTSYKIDRKSCFVQDVKTCPSKKHCIVISFSWMIVV